MIGSKGKSKVLVKRLALGEEFLNNNPIKILRKIKKINNSRKRKIMIAINIRVNFQMTNSMEKVNFVPKSKITFMKDNL